MGTTDILSLPFPELEDPADVPSDVEALAAALDTNHGGGILPIGGGCLWFTPTPPDNYLFALGQPIPAGYPLLIAKFGANMPDMRDLVPIGASATKAVGSTGGEARVKLKAAESGTAVHGHLNSFAVVNKPAFNTGTESADHTHQPALISHNFITAEDGYAPGAPVTVNGGSTFVVLQAPSLVQKFGAQTATGGRSAAHVHTVPIHGHSMSGGVTNALAADAVEDHNNIQPYRAVNYIIRGR